MDRAAVAGLALRAVLAATAVVAFYFAQQTLGPRARIVARFGLGVGLFALLVDAGRTVAGRGPPIDDAFTPHQQRATEQVDETYADVRTAVEHFVEDGVLTRDLEQTVQDTCRARGLDEPDLERVLDELQAAAREGPDTHRPVSVGLLAGFGVTIGLSLAVATVAQATGLPVLAPVTIVGGVSITMLQLRARRGRANHTALALGVLGSVLTGLGGLQLGAVTVAGVFVLGIALAGLAGSIVAWWTHEERREPWRRVRREMRANLTSLRRAFLATLGIGVVLFPFKPALDALASAIGLGLDTPYQVAVIAFVTVATYVALEGAGTWIALARDQREAQRQRETRASTIRAVLDELDRHAGHHLGGDTR